VIAARSTDEPAVVEQLAHSGRDDVRLLDRRQLAGHVELSDDVLGGAHLPLDIRVNSRHALSAIAEWIQGRGGAQIWWSTSLLGLDGRPCTPLAVK